jgi:hypothetical protein
MQTVERGFSTTFVCMLDFHVFLHARSYFDTYASCVVHRQDSTWTQTEVLTLNLSFNQVWPKYGFTCTLRVLRQDIAKSRHISVHRTIPCYTVLCSCTCLSVPMLSQVWSSRSSCQIESYIDEARTPKKKRTGTQSTQITLLLK